jgi:hypothetical protein
MEPAAELDIVPEGRCREREPVEGLLAPWQKGAVDEA